jgi:quercetin dioxygenase-like cupin family protein
MIRSDEQLLVHVDELEPAPVRREEGWQDMDIRFITGELSGAETSCLFRARFPAGARHERHFHPNADEFFYVLSGRAAVGAGEEEHVATPGTVQFIPAGVVHWLRNLGETEPVEVVGVYVGGASLEEAGYEYAGEITEEYRTADVG